MSLARIGVVTRVISARLFIYVKRWAFLMPEIFIKKTEGSMAVKIIGGVLAAFGILIIYGNYSAMITNFINHKKHIDRFVSMIPLIGGINLCIGLLLLLTNHKPLAFLPLIADPSVPSSVYGIVYSLIKEKNKK